MAQETSFSSLRLYNWYALHDAVPVDDRSLTLGLWHLHQTQERAWLTCELLERWPHGFFTRLGAADPAGCAHHLGLPSERAVCLHQVHGAEIFTPEQLPARGDALIAREPAVSVWVASADCVPVLLASDRYVAAIHAGWRGTAQAILPKTLGALQRQGIDLTAVRVAIGPAIGLHRYPVGPEVALQVLDTLGIDTPQSHLDLKEINRQQALAQGVRPENISVSPYCTYDHADLFYSYRRDGRSGVQFSGIARP
ncbi:polyphenol oxidase family protein [Anthocerotibacter panamensis]|uniref:polyphenol oxidase family protein n=1 Tax=Anthocerotibacter panamensis TaxID=2857077 RepID=UPI001C401910|nr:polyphenol oxidase family protein [Anthocerotibacter panamensis]